MTTFPEAASRLRAWIHAGERAQNKYGYEGAGRDPIEPDIVAVIDELDRIEAQTNRFLDLSTAHLSPASMEWLNSASRLNEAACDNNTDRGAGPIPSFMEKQ